MCSIRPRTRPQLSRQATAVLAFVTLAAPAYATGDLLQWFRKEVLDRIQINGRRTFGYHSHSVRGDEEAFKLLTYYGYGGKTFTDVGYMNVQGRNVAGFANFETNIDTSRFRDPQQQRFTLEYRKRPLEISLGDIQASMLNTNRFVTFNKLLAGGVATYTHGRAQVRALYSEARGSARTITLQGNNSVGPYYLNFNQIIRGSESVQVDGQQLRLGTDYVINYEAGYLTFVDRIVPPTSTIVVTFDALGFNSQRGTVQGAGMTYDFGRAGRLGLTTMEQRTGASGRLSTRLERFQGAGAPSTPYFLQFEPLLSFPVIVRLDGILQTLGVDYVFDEFNPTIFYFTRFVPLTSTIDVVYTPKPTEVLDGDRRVWGFDYRIPLGVRGQNGFLAYSQATGKLESPVNPLEGTARGLEGQYKLGPWRVGAFLRDVPADYVSVETRGFSRNEASNGWNLQYAKNPWTIDVDHTNNSIATRVVGTNGDIGFRRDRVTRLRLGATYNADLSQPWSFDYTRLRNDVADRQVSVDTVALSTSRSFGQLQTRAYLQSQEARGPVNEGNKVTTQDLRLRTARLEATYPAGRAWSFRAQGSVSDVQVGGRSGLGTDASLGVSYQPSSNFELSASHFVSDSGELALLGGFQNGYGLGFNGNGFSSGYTGTTFSTGATDTRLTQLIAYWRISPRVDLRGSVVQRRDAGSISSNSETSTYDLDVSVDMGAGHRINAALNRSRSRFLGSGAIAEATNFDLSYTASPPGRLHYALGMSGLLSGGSSEFQQDGVSFFGTASYRVAPRQWIRSTLRSGRTTGYLGQDESYFELAYDYEIWRGVSLVTSYKFRDVRNLDPSATSGAYRSSGFDVELTFTFGR